MAAAAGRFFVYVVRAGTDMQTLSLCQAPAAMRRITAGPLAAAATTGEDRGDILVVLPLQRIGLEGNVGVRVTTARQDGALRRLIQKRNATERMAMQHYQRALITSASRGIGRAFARQMPGTTDMLLTGRDDGRLGDVVQRLTRAGRRVERLAADLTIREDRDRLVEAAETFGIDLLVNNAGGGRLGRFLDSPADVEQQTVLLNAVAVVDLTRRLLPGMLARARGSQRRAGLIVVASTAAFAPLPMLATYAASKAFDLHFTEALAEELRDEPVDVMALCPGATRTSFGERAGWRGGSLPCAAEPDDVAADALRSLGRQTVCVAGSSLRKAALKPVVTPRRLLTGALGLAMRFAAGKP